MAIHVPCSSKKMGIEESFAKLAGLCANEVSCLRMRVHACLAHMRHGLVRHTGLVGVAARYFAT